VTRADCPRLFEAEARRDGRLTGTERASFERHLSACPACSREVQALEALAASLRNDDRGGVDELHERRERTWLLAAFERSRIAPEPQPFARRRVLLPALVALLAAVAVVLFVRARDAGDAAKVSAVIQPRGTATWSRRVDSQAERVFLRDGTLRIQRAHDAAAPRLLVILPDGELEDIGTTFTVSTSGGRTTHVSVEEGRVMLRLHGKTPVTLGRGGIFTAETPPPADSARVAPLVPSSSSATSAMPATSRRPARLPREPVLAPAPAPSAAEPSPATRDENAAREFRTATSALDAGDNGAAAAAFARFLAHYGKDPRAEDAAYLRVIALQRAGNVPATRSAAQEYVRRYPAGFRRTEVEALLGE
jgi:hypothetical protein